MRAWPVVLGGVLLCLTGCWGSTKAGDETISNHSSHPRGLFVITEAAFGPIGPTAPATLDALRQMFPRYEVKPVNDGSLEYDVFDKGERLLFVVPNDDGTVFNVHATSRKVAVANRSWRVGESFQGASSLTACECWGENPTCYRAGEHIAVNFKRSCEGLTFSGRRALQVLDGVEVARVIWSPTPFGGDHTYGGDGYGGAGDPCGGGGDPCGGP
jgi:hypothetical protein